jgi:hypothetical protein
MTLAEKSAKLLEYSLILKADDKKNWLELLPKMSDKQVQTLYGVLVDEVKAWKKEGISIIPDMAVESGLMPQEQPGASVKALMSRLEGKTPPAQLPKAPAKSVPNTPFAKELDREVHTPELKAPAATPVPQSAAAEDKPDAVPVFGEIKPDLPNPDKNAWMLSNKVVVPKTPLGVVNPQPLGVPKIRNRVAKHGLRELRDIKSVDDLGKIEAAHLRQGPLPEQVAFVKQRIAQLARENDMLPINILPVFEQSPLFQSYLKAGALLIERNTGDDKNMVLDQVMGELESMGQDTLSQQEFEAVADLKKDLETMAGL